ncbi:hypothetical protein L2E82_06617 [Cichorium intybus]|uniref:Uncharacterized protein n=1 Tax=Cichorium intybus TaxID=13427 RepID=A0ACB9HA11_CICIN|nr:hypothetical protein L2E82_06617 [Cichorium intybus]
MGLIWLCLRELIYKPEVPASRLTIRRHAGVSLLKETWWSFIIKETWWSFFFLIRYISAATILISPSPVDIPTDQI